MVKEFKQCRRQLRRVKQAVQNQQKVLSALPKIKNEKIITMFSKLESQKNEMHDQIEALVNARYVQALQKSNNQEYIKTIKELMLTI